MTGDFKYIPPPVCDAIYQYTVGLTSEERINLIALIRCGRQHLNQDGSTWPPHVASCKAADDLLKILGVNP